MNWDQATRLRPGDRLIAHDNADAPFTILYFIQLATESEEEARRRGTFLVRATVKQFTTATIGVGSIFDGSKLAVFTDKLWETVVKFERTKATMNNIFADACKGTAPGEGKFIKRSGRDLTINLTAQAPRYDLFLKSFRKEEDSGAKPEQPAATRQVGAGNGLTGGTSVELQGIKFNASTTEIEKANEVELARLGEAIRAFNRNLANARGKRAG